MASESNKRRAGRPTTPGNVDEKSTLSLRASFALKAQILAASAKNDRSISAEMELRLEQSFQQDRVLAALERIEAKLSSQFPSRVLEGLWTRYEESERLAALL